MTEPKTPRRAPTWTLPAFALPFVTRSLRGPRKKRAIAGSALLAFVALFVGSWLALGSGQVEQKLRQDLGLEQYEYERERATYTVYTRSGLDAETLRALVEDEIQLPSREMGPEAWGEMDRYRQLQQQPLISIVAMANSPANRGTMIMRDRARQFIAAHPDAFTEDILYSYMGVPEEGIDDAPLSSYRDDDIWGTQDYDVAVLAMDHDLVPNVETYGSPLGVTHAIGLIGIVASGIFTILLLVVAPVAVGAQQAQERHENTLMPLTATSLSARELVLGLAAGPLAHVLILAAPQLLIALVTAAVLGTTVISVVLGAALTVVMAAPLVLGGQMLGHLAGRRHAPGLVTFALLAMFVPLWFMGSTLASEVGVDGHYDADLARMLAILPTAAPLSWLEGAFVGSLYDYAGTRPEWAGYVTMGFRTAQLATLVGALSAVGISALLLRALDRHVAGADGASLTRRESYLGAGLFALLFAFVVPFGPLAFDVHEEFRASEFYLATLGMLAPAFALMVMARVPFATAPSLREVPMKAIFTDLGVWFGAHLVIATLLGLTVEAELLGTWHPVALVYLAWAVFTLGLLAMRAVAYPLGFVGAAMVMLTTFMGGMAYFHIIGFSESASHMQPLAMGQLSPMLGVLQLGLLIAVPWGLMRGLKKHCKLS